MRPSGRPSSDKFHHFCHEPFGRGFARRNDEEKIDDDFKWRKKLLLKMMGFDSEKDFLEDYKRMLEIHLADVNKKLQELKKEE
jgi:hypothetical protein